MSHTPPPTALIQLLFFYIVKHLRSQMNSLPVPLFTQYSTLKIIGMLVLLECDPTQSACPRAFHNLCVILLSWDWVPIFSHPTFAGFLNWCSFICHFETFVGWVWCFRRVLKAALLLSEFVWPVKPDGKFAWGNLLPNSQLCRFLLKWLDFIHKFTEQR